MSTPTVRDVAIMLTTHLAASVLLRIAAGCRWSAAKVRWLSGATWRLADRLERQ